MDKVETDARWESNKELLQSLYIAQKYTLDQVRIEMGSRGFEASNAQYERKFKKWKFRKNLTRREWAELDTIISGRKACGKKTEILLNGCIIPEKKVRKETLRSRSASQNKGIEEGMFASGALDRVKICTPVSSPSPVPHPVTPNVSTLGHEWPPLAGESFFLLDDTTPFQGNSDCILGNLGILPDGEYSWSARLPFLQLENFLDSHAPSLRQALSATSLSSGLELAPRNGPASTEGISQSPQPIVFLHLLNVLGQADFSTPALILDRINSMLPKICNDGGIPIVQKRNWHTEHDMHFELFKCVLISLSNGVLVPRAEQNQALISWLRQVGGHKFIEQILAMQGIASDSLVEKLFQCAVRARDLQVIRTLLKAGLDPNNQMIQDYDGSLRSPLSYACEYGDLGMVSALVDAGADVDDGNATNSKIPLAVAIANGHSDLALLLLDAGASVNRADLPDFTPLISAAWKRSAKVVEQLLLRGANVNQCSQSGETALHKTISPGYEGGLSVLDPDETYEIISLLLSYGADVNAYIRHVGGKKSYEGDTVLERAAEFGNIRIAKLLLSGGAKVTKATMCHAAKSSNLEMVQLILDAGADVNDVARYGNTALTQAARDSNVKLVSFLLRNGARVDGELNGDTMTPLQEASYAGNIEVVQILLDNGAEVNVPAKMHDCWDRKHDPWGFNDFRGTALQAAAHCQQTEVAQLLLKLGANADAPTRYPGSPALVSAITGENVKLVKILLEAGANVDGHFEDPSDHSPLRSAIETRNLSLVEILLEAGADVNQMCPGTLLLSAISKGSPEIVRALLDAGAAVDETAFHANPPFPEVIRMGNRDLIQQFLDRGVDINHPNAKLRGFTALAAAAGGNDLDLVKLLLSYGADPNDSAALVLVVHYKSSDELIRTLLHAQMNPQRLPTKKYGLTALQTAIRAGDHNMVTLFLKSGIDANEIIPRQHYNRAKYQGKIFEDENALATAIKISRNGDLSLIRLLISAGANPNGVVTREPRRTALLLGIETGDLAVVKLLIESGATINHPAEKGLTRSPLQRAAETGSLEIVQYLISLGADINAPPALNGGATALQAAAIGGYISIANTLLTYGANVNAVGARANGRTALEGAAEHGRIDMLQLLLDAGADITAGASSQYTRALQFAAENGHNAAKKLLMTYYSQNMTENDSRHLLSARP